MTNMMSSCWNYTNFDGCFCDVELTVTLAEFTYGLP